MNNETYEVLKDEISKEIKVNTTIIPADYSVIIITPQGEFNINDLLKCYEERNTPPKLMTVSQYARAKKINLAHKPVSTQAVYMWIKDRKLKTVKVGKITLIVA